MSVPFLFSTLKYELKVEFGTLKFHRMNSGSRSSIKFADSNTLSYNKKAFNSSVTYDMSILKDEPIKLILRRYHHLILLIKYVFTICNSITHRKREQLINENTYSESHGLVHSLSHNDFV